MFQFAANIKEYPLDIVGGNSFGRYPKISQEQTWNMIVSQDEQAGYKFLVPYAGYSLITRISQSGTARGLFSSVRGGFMVGVIDQNVYTIKQTSMNVVDFDVELVGSVRTFTGDVYMDENEKNEIAICDQKDIFIYNYVTGTFVQSVTSGVMPPGLDFIPSYVQYQDGYFIAPDSGTPTWRLSSLVDSHLWPNSSNTVGTFQTKADNPLACVRMPGRENQLFILGSIVTEAWFDTGAQLFPYQRSSGFNIDYGCLNQATIATSDKFIIWLGGNEKSGPVIMYSSGGDIQQVSTEGINFLFAKLKNPYDSFGFLFKQDGHLIYQLTFNEDNFSLALDFTTMKFFFVSDENMNKHIAKKVVFYNGAYFFLSTIDGNLYELSTQFTNYNYGKVDSNNNPVNWEIPRIRITRPLRMPDASFFCVNHATFTLEQGDSVDIPRIDMTISKNGGVTFGSAVPKILNAQANRKNRLYWWSLGRCNDITFQFRFWGFGRFVVTDGLVGTYQ